MPEILSPSLKKEHQLIQLGLYKKIEIKATIYYC